MNRIRLLPEQVANQIAAGEVVERPASVVKELVENSLDAQATRISVEIIAGGRSLIRVVDDGIGMSRDDALLCFERHATSKIKRAEDLSHIQTMGFRGEALPSIASVSRLTLVTRERAETEEGTQVVIHGGKIIEAKAAGCATGASLEVRQLFFNLPARRKFLRSEETERAHIHHYLVLAALSHPDVAFTFLQEGRVIWQLPALPTGNDTKTRLAALRERIRSLPSGETALLPVDFSAELEATQNEPDPPSDREIVRIWGLIGEPGVSRGNRDDQHLFVNRRPVENRGLNYALLEGYHTALMKGRYPVCCLFLELNPGAVDVNIHPAKKEVKFHQEHWVRRLVAQAVREALLGYHQARTSPAQISPPTAPPTTKPEIRPDPLPLHTPTLNLSPARSEHGVTPGEELLARLDAPVPLTRTPTPGFPKQPISPVQSTANPVSSAPPASVPSTPAGPGVEPVGQTERPTGPVAPAEPVPLLNVPLRLIGVIGNLYVLLESDRGLVLMDQHAAHERILFEQMLRRLEQGQAPSQRLLLPETVEVSVRDAQFLREQLNNLTRLGVGLSEFGERTFLLDSLPPFVKVKDARRFVLELLDELKAAGDDVNTWRLGEQTVAKTVCRHAVKAHDPLSGPELENLVRDLRHCAMPYTCPHGRPTLVEINYRELEKKFGRIT